MSSLTQRILQKHTKLEKNVSLLFVFSLLAVLVGGIVEIAPLFYLENTTKYSSRIQWRGIWFWLTCGHVLSSMSQHYCCIETLPVAF